MKVRLVSVFRISGVAKATGAEFGPLYRIGILRPLELVDSPKFKKHGNGNEISEIEVSEDVFKKFLTIQIPPGGYVEIEATTEDAYGRNGIETVVTGFTAPAVKAAA